MTNDPPAVVSIRDPLNHAPDRGSVALLLIDVINDLEFAGGDALREHFLPAARRIATLKVRARMHGIPVIYANDNFGRWRSDFKRIVHNSLDDGIRGREIVELLQPDEDDYFILKPKHSAFFQTNLEILLRYLGTTTLILTGVAGDRCVLFTANDAYMRDFKIFVPADCIASEDPEQNCAVIELMGRVLKADTRPEGEIVDFEALPLDPGPSGRVEET